MPVAMSPPETVAIPKRERKTHTQRHPGWRVVLFNDDVNAIEMVILALQKAAGLSIEVAEMVAREAHQEGSAVVKRGLNEEDAAVMCGNLKRYSRIPGITPGVTAIPEIDD